MKSDTGIVISYYERGCIVAKTPSGKELKIKINTDYPYDGKIEFDIQTEDTSSFDISLRIPAWSENATLKIGALLEKLSPGYKKFSYNKAMGEKIILDLPMEIREIPPHRAAHEKDLFSAYEYGPIVLAADKRILDPDAPIELIRNSDGQILSKKVYCPEIKEAHICLEAKSTEGKSVRLIDYASAGKSWSEKSRMAAWIRKK